FLRLNPLWQGASPSVGGMLTFEASKQFRLHLNSSFVLDDSVEFDDGRRDVSRGYALGITTFNQVKSGAALEGRLEIGDVRVNPFLEYTVDVPLGAGVLPMRLAPGVRVLPWRGLFIDGSVELGLTSKHVAGVPPVPGYLALLSIGYQFGFDSGGKPQV